ncbi:hypothetical protein KPH14_007897 [Odynerus spinipes]|uniref:Uncharacterized protein n=1 Tax=Odynerus spinipes TaxID=1348599 RepID=A0AAD9VY79_9HYME|nr:hypothetical protein KPH14_007897 [Odynerus spinipes]
MSGYGQQERTGIGSCTRRGRSSRCGEKKFYLFWDFISSTGKSMGVNNLIEKKWNLFIFRRRNEGTKIQGKDIFIGSEMRFSVRQMKIFLQYDMNNFTRKFESFCDSDWLLGWRHRIQFLCS